MKPAIRFGVALALVGAIGACSGDSSGPSYEETMTGGMAGDIGEWAYNVIPNAFSGMNFTHPMVGIGAPPAPLPPGRSPRWDLDPRHPEALRGTLQAAMADGCTTSSSGNDGDVWDPYDGNGNGVADDWTVSVTCVETDEPIPGVTRVETTEETMRIKERTGDIFGFDASSHYRSHEVYSNGDDEDWFIDQLHNVSVTANGGTAKYQVHYWQDYFDDGVHDKQDRELNVQFAYDPDGTIAADAEHLPDGVVEITGSAHNLEASGNYRFEFSTPEPWIYSSECDLGVEEQPFVGGVLLGAFNGDQEVGFSLSWGACGDGNSFLTFGGDSAPAASRQLLRGYTFPRH